MYPHDEADDAIGFYAGVLESGLAQTRELFFKPLGRWFALSVFPIEEDEFTVVLQGTSDRTWMNNEIGVAAGTQQRNPSTDRAQPDSG